MAVVRPPSPPIVQDLLAMVGVDQKKATHEQLAAAGRLATFLSAVGGTMQADAVAVELEVVKQAAQFDPSQPIPFVGEYGVQTFPRLGSKVSVGMAVVIQNQRIVPASYDTIATTGPANAVVMEVTGESIKVCSGAASGPMRVLSPVVGGRVFLYTGGVGTCDVALFPVGATSTAYAVCAATQKDPQGCVRCASISFGGAQVEFVDQDGYLRRNVDNMLLPSGGNNTGFTGDATGYLLYMHNTGSGGGWLIECDGGSNTTSGISVSTLLSKTGISVQSESGSCFSGSNFSVGPTAAFSNADTASGSFHLSLGFQGVVSDFEGMDFVANTIVFYGEAGGGNMLTLTPDNTGAWGTLTQVLQARNGTVGVLAVDAQTITSTADTIDPNIARTVVLTNVTGNITLASTPTIPDGTYDGQTLVVINSLSSTSRVILQRGSTFNLALSAASIILNPGGSACLEWVASEARWFQTGFVTSTA